MRRTVLAALMLLSIGVQSPATAQRAPNEFWVNPGFAITESDLNQYFAHFADVACVCTLEAVSAEFRTAEVSSLVTRLTFRVTESIKGGLPVNDVVTVLAAGGTYLEMSGGTHVPRGLAEDAEGLIVGASYFVGAYAQDGAKWLAGGASVVRLDGDSAVGPAGREDWATQVVQRGRAQILAQNPTAQPSDRTAFLTAVRSAAGSL